jgi:hypothetical protein
MCNAESNPEKMYKDWMKLYQEPGSEFNLKHERSGLVGVGAGAGAGAGGDAGDGGSSSGNAAATWRRTKDNNYLKVSCMDVCEYMFHVLNRRAGNYVPVNLCVGFFLAVIIIYSFYQAYASVFAHSVYTKAYFIASIYLLAAFFPVLFMFCMAGMADVYRRYQISRMLRELINVSDVKMVDTRTYQRSKMFSKNRRVAVQLHACPFERHETYKSFGRTALPRIDMSMPSNYISWCMCRQVLARFGHRFLFRVNLYLGTALLPCLSLCRSVGL